MLNRSANTATYDQDVAKIEINLPDELLQQIDEYVKRSGETREGFLRRLVLTEIAIEGAIQREEWDKVIGRSLPADVDYVQMIREDRDRDNRH
jgi:metal-responsive CopG/Arc/MetJ family transcriptional regulator